MFLGVEIGGTKLQLGLGEGNGLPLAGLVRLEVQPQFGAERILEQIHQAAAPLIARDAPRAVGFGFGGPVDSQSGRTRISHQVEGWRDFPLADWAARTLGLPALVANDSDCAGLAEARFGAGRGGRIVFYSNVGSGIGGALVIEGRLFPGGNGVAAELGHLRPGPQCEDPAQTVESLASGWAITSWVKQQVTRSGEKSPDVEDLLERSGGDLQRLSTHVVAQAGAAGNLLAREALDRACRVYGWGLAQMITLVAPNVVVIGGGVSLIGEPLWLAPLRDYVRKYAFPPLADTYQICAAALGEEVVVHGALALLSLSGY